MSELHFMKFREQPIVFLSLDRDEKGLFTGWLFKFDKNGYVKNYDFGIDLINFYPIDKFKTNDLKKDIIKFIIFNQENEYKRDMVLDALSKITRVIE